MCVLATPLKISFFQQSFSMQLIIARIYNVGQDQEGFQQPTDHNLHSFPFKSRTTSVGTDLSQFACKTGLSLIWVRTILTLKAPIATKVVCFSRLLKCLRSLYGKQCGPRSDCSYRSSLFWVHAVASILNLSVMLGNYLQQTTSAEDIFRCIFFLAL